MDGSRDFIQWLGEDMSLEVLMYLEDPSDLVRTSAVTSSWRKFVIANGLCKKLCLKMFPEASSFARVIEPVASATDDSAKWAWLEREHRAYASLSRGLTTYTRENCISVAICASSTDNYPEESIKNTLETSDMVDHRASYWSSKGDSNPAAPETLLYKLASKLCLINEVHVHPFQGYSRPSVGISSLSYVLFSTDPKIAFGPAYFQFGFPIYSAKAVRFQVGHPKVPLEVESDDRDEFLDAQDFFDDQFVWTYSSPEFPMAQENCLQKFKLPEPVLCIGGILKLELLGRMQTQEMDGLYYICITHVQVIGRPLSPAFDVEIIDDQGRCTLKYNPENLQNSSSAELLAAQSSSRSHFHRFSESLRTWEQMIMNTFRGAGPLVMDDYDSDYEYLD